MPRYKHIPTGPAGNLASLASAAIGDAAQKLILAPDVESFTVAYVKSRVSTLSTFQIRVTLRDGTIKSDADTDPRNAADRLVGPPPKERPSHVHRRYYAPYARPVPRD
ncbi:hypothetical protein Kuura_055 [Caulobacter phage Kuura]|nr:hypothetical protein Kuura_055 [Caulobacter phage Kuura]